MSGNVATMILNKTLEKKDDVRLCVVTKISLERKREKKAQQYKWYWQLHVTIIKKYDQYQINLFLMIQWSP